MKDRIWVNPDGLRVIGRGEDGGHWEDGDFTPRVYEVRGPSLFQKIKPYALAAVRPLPCLSVWAGMIATYFWNAFRSLPETPISAFIELPEGTPERLITALSETAVFLVWTLCFRATIKSAIRSEFAEK